MVNLSLGGQTRDPIKLDLGCGPNKKAGFIGCDQHPMSGVDQVFDIGLARWPFADASVEEINASHFIEHLTAMQRVHVYNEAYRVLLAGGKMTITTPHWASNRAYGDPTHQWPPVSEMSFYYLKREWRLAQAPHTDAEWLTGGYACDFDATWGYALHPALHVRSAEHNQFAMQFYKEAAQDMACTLTKR